MEKLLTISVATFNNLEFTKQFIESLFATTNTPFDLIIVDNNSTDGTQNYLRDLQSKRDIQVILNNKNTGFGPAHNQAFGICKTKYIAPMNNDIVVPMYFMDRSFKTFINNPEYKQLGAMQKNNVEETEILTSDLFSPIITDIKAPQDFVGGSFFITEKDLIEKIGGLFDEQFEIGFCEDVDLSWRISLAGYKIGCISNLYYTHFGNTSFDNNSDKILSKSNYYIKNTRKLIIKWNSEIKDDLRKQLKENSEIGDLVVVKTPLKNRNFYKNCDQGQFKKDLLTCLAEPKNHLIDIIEKYQSSTT